MMLVLASCLLQIVKTISAFNIPDQEDAVAFCQQKYENLFYSELPLDRLTTSQTYAIHNYRDTLIEQHRIRTLLEDFYPLELSSLRYNLIRYSNQSALLFVSCRSLNPASDPNAAYYSAFVIHKPRIDSRPHWCWIRRVNLTDTTDPAFPTRWQRFQLASNSDFTIVRLQVCLETELFLDTFIQDLNPFGCRSTDTRGVPRDTDRSQLEANCRRMIQTLEEVRQEEVHRINGTPVVASMYSLLGLVSCAALVWLLLLLGRASQRVQSESEP